MHSIILIAHNLRSTHNVGSLLRTADGLGVHEVILSGYTPYPLTKDDVRLPHLAQKTHRQIVKTALGAESTQRWSQCDDVANTILALRGADYRIVALEQTSNSTPLHAYTARDKIALILGREVEGIEYEVLQLCDEAVEIPMFGSKESFNVVQAAAMALYQFTFIVG